MAGYQYCVIIGNVGRDPEMRYLPSGVPVCSFSVAVSESWTDRQTNEKKERTNWYRVSAWRQLAEICNKYVYKGMQIMVTGTPTASAFLGQDGQPRASLELTARDVQFLGSRSDRPEGASSSSSSRSYDNDDNYPPNEPDDIPF